MIKITMKKQSKNSKNNRNEPRKKKDCKNCVPTDPKAKWYNHPIDSCPLRCWDLYYGLRD